MYAVVEAGGKQIKVSPGDRVRVEKMGTAVGENVVIHNVLMIAEDESTIKLGSPYVKDAAIDGRVLRHSKDRKVTVFKYKPKKRYRNKTGHRQQYTILEIDTIRFGDKVFGTAREVAPAVSKRRPERLEIERDEEKGTRKIADEEKPAKKGTRKIAEPEKETKAKKTTRKSADDETDLKLKKSPRKSSNDKKKDS